MLSIRCESKNVTHVLLAGQTYRVGRKGGDITFPDDSSISREHAEISVEHPPANVTDHLLIPTVVITDLGSKFGTFANDGIERKSTMAMREPMNLSPGDRFRFGLQWNEFKIHYTPLVVTPSTLKEPMRLRNVIMVLGGHVVSEWSEKCQYCVMESLTLTVKAVCALLSAKHIVTPAFFNDLIECVKTNKPHPNPTNFLPRIGEKSLDGGGLSFEPNEARSQLFVGKTFLFSSQKHLRKLEVAIKCGGGSCALITSVSTKDLGKENYIVIKPSTEYALLDRPIQKAIDAYKDKKKRCISDSEIGLAAVNISTSKHCNPFYSMSDAVFPKKLGSQTQPSQSSSPRVLVPETQPATQLSTGSSQASRNIVEETFVATGRVKEEPMSEVNGASETSGASGSKRPVNGRTADKDDGAASSKKRSAEDSLAPKASGSKRLRSDAQAHKTLSSLFGFSDDEDEDVAVLAEATPSGSARRANNENFNSETVNPYTDPSLEVIPATIDRVPDSPEVIDLSDEDEIASKQNEPNIEVSPTPKLDERRSTRSRSKRTEQVEPEPSTSATNKGQTKRKRGSSEASPEASTVSKARKTETEGKKASDGDDLTTKAEKLTIKTEIKNEDNKNDLPADPKIPVIFVEVLYKPKMLPSVQQVDGKTVKNFKTFQKVLSLPQRLRNSTETSGRSSAVSRTSLNATILTYEVFDHRPNHPFENCRRRSPSVEADDRRDISMDDENMEFDDVPSTSRTAVQPRQKKTMQNQSVAATTTPTRSSGRTTRGTTRSNPPPFIVPQDDEDDDEDMWQFG